MSAEGGKHGTPEDGWVEIFRAGRQAWKVRGVFWFLCALCLGSLVWGADLIQQYGLSAGDGGVLRPLPERLAWGGLVSLLGLAAAGGMAFYVRLYICAVWWCAARRRVRFGLMRFWGTAFLEAGTQEILGSQFQPGDFDTLEHTIHAPWYAVRLRGRKLALILDGQGELLHPGVAVRLLNLK